MIWNAAENSDDACPKLLLSAVGKQDSSQQQLSYLFTLCKLVFNLVDARARNMLL